ncbi:MAG: hypothetical protein P8J27_07170, partial [Mariniblastus sp.]|nr:hypothetical protein [Mariniblastus sp.]
MMMPLIMSADEKLFRLLCALESSPSDFLFFLQEHPTQPNNPEGDVELFFVAHPFISRELDGMLCQIFRG